MINEVQSAGLLLIRKEITLAFAESATAGRAVFEFSTVPDAGQFLKGGLDLIEEHTPESRQVTEAITIGLSRLIPANVHIGITGLTTPGGSETKEKPVGTMFVHALKDGKETIFAERLFFDGSPEDIIIKTVRHIGISLNNYFEDAQE
jgi:nicotinamide-nucleotide amidase